MGEINGCCCCCTDCVALERRGISKILVGLKADVAEMSKGVELALKLQME